MELSGYNFFFSIPKLYLCRFENFVVYDESNTYRKNINSYSHHGVSSHFCGDAL